MKNRQIPTITYGKKIIIPALIWLCSIPALQAQSVYTQEDFMKNNEKAVETVVQDFYQALNALFTGNVEPMKEVWSHADDVTYMGPAGKLRSGWADVLADWKAQADLKLGGKVEPLKLHITIGPRLAVVVNEEIGENVDAKGNTQKVSIRATHIFRKEQGGWKMIADHTDLLPFLSQASTGMNE